MLSLSTDQSCVKSKPTIPLLSLSRQQQQQHIIMTPLLRMIALIFVVKIFIGCDTIPLSAVQAYQTIQSIRRVSSRNIKPTIRSSNGLLFPAKTTSSRTTTSNNDLPPKWTQSPLFSSSMNQQNESRNNKISKRVLVTRLLLGLIVFGTGYQWGVSRPEEQVMKRLLKSSSSSAATAIPTSPSRRLFTVLLSSLVVWLLVREGWRAIPSWAKPSLIQRAIQDTRRLFGLATTTTNTKTKKSTSSSSLPPIRAVSTTSNTSADNNAPGQELKDDNDDCDDDDISNFATLTRKLNGVLEVAQRRMPPESLENFNWQLSLLTLLGLLQQQKAVSAQDRDAMYASCGPPVTATDLEGLEDYMDLADAAYNEFSEEGMTLPNYLQQKGYDLIKHDITVLPGYLGHYVALSQTEKVALIGVKGTSSLEDLVTDMCGAAISHELPGPFVENGPTTIRAHEGILLSSRRLADQLQPVVEKLLVPQDYKIVVVGHSLGAAAAALLAVVLQSRIPALQPSSFDGYTNNKLHVYAFASPPNLDLQSALACQSFVTTIVNNCDVIPRCNAGPVLVTMELLKTINDKLLEQEDQGGNNKEKRLGLMSTWKVFQTTTLANRKWFRKPPKEDEEQEPMLMDSKQLGEAFDRAFEKVGSNDEDQDQLYVAGKVILMYDLWEEESEYNENLLGDGGDDTPEYDYSADRAVRAEPLAKVLRYLEFDGRMLEDHLAPAYKNSLKALCRDVTG